MASGESDVAASTKNSLAEGIRFYIVRSDNSMVPLVPVDQLRFDLHSIPRKLDHQQLSKESWQWVGNTKDFPHLLQHHEAGLAPKVRDFRAPDHEVRTTALGSLFTTPEMKGPHAACQTVSPLRAPMGPFTVAEKSRPFTTLNPPHSAPARFFMLGSSAPTDDHKSYTEGIASVYQKDAQRYGFSPRLPPSGIEPDPSKKEYCTHWIKTGDCAFMAQGCLYKHEMPSPQKLREIGFNAVPRWWKEKSALRGPTWMQRRMQEHEDAGHEEEVASPQRSIEQLLERLGKDREPKRSIFKKNIDEHPRGILKEEDSDVAPTPVITPNFSKRIPNLIDFDIPAPPPTRRHSGSSTTSVTPPASEMSSGPASPSIQATPPVGNVKLRKLPSVAELSHHTANNKPEKNFLLRRHSSISMSSDGEQLRQKPVKPLAQLPRPSKKAGLAQSKHAVKDTATVDAASKVNGDKCEASRSLGLQTQKARGGKGRGRREKRTAPNKQITL